MLTRDIMNAPVIAIAPDTPVVTIAALLLERHISGVPVVDSGRVVGLVNEADLLWRHEIGTDASTPRSPWWVRLMERDRAPGDYVKSHARYATDIMTRDVVSVGEGMPLSRLVSLFASRAVRRIVVSREDELVGIVTRADLVRAVAQRSAANTTRRQQSDPAIRKQLLTELKRQSWWRAGESRVFVSEGIVYYQGLIANEDERRAARVAAENIPGVNRIVDSRTMWQAMLVT